MDLMVQPPNEKICSKQTVQKYKDETTGIINELKKKALVMHDKFNKMKNVTCNEIEGAMYAFPQIRLPKEFLEEAAKKKLHPDYLYSLKLMENTGIICVPGSGFGEKDGTYHFRVTNLICPSEELEKALDKINHFNDTMIFKK